MRAGREFVLTPRAALLAPRLATVLAEGHVTTVLLPEVERRLVSEAPGVEPALR